MIVPGYDLVVTPKRTLQADKLTLTVAERELMPLLSVLSRNNAP